MDQGSLIERPCGRFYVCSSAEHAPDSSVACVIGKQLKLSPKALGTFLRCDIPQRAEDLLVIAGVISYADRRTTRHHATCWERDLHLSIPVRDFDFWNDPDVRSDLIDLLGALTGDSWNLEFRAGRSPLPVDPQSNLELADTPPIVIPYSNGIDSFAVARLHAGPGQQVIRVSTGSVGDTEKKTGGSCPSATRWVAMPISLPNADGKLREQSYRSRGFLFGAVAATAAGLMDGREVLIPESGQGTFGPSLTVIGQEHPDVRMSPVFTSKLSRLVSRLFESPIQFVHPRIWCTKGETLDALRQAGLSEGWGKTVSCSRGSRKKIEAANARHCGLCANCLLRRQSLLASGLSGEEYIWPDLALAPPWSFGNATAPGDSKVQQAISAVLAMRELAALDPSDPIVLREARMLAEPLGQSTESSLGQLQRVLKKHRDEWQAFAGSRPRSSLINEFGALE